MRPGLRDSCSDGEPHALGGRDGRMCEYCMERDKVKDCNSILKSFFFFHWFVNWNWDQAVFSGHSMILGRSGQR